MVFRCGGEIYGCRWTAFLLDFSKAFDKVTHKSLARKLQHYEIWEGPRLESLQTLCFSAMIL